MEGDYESNYENESNSKSISKKKPMFGKRPSEHADDPADGSNQQLEKTNEETFS